MKRGLFITLEGPEGSGKSTQARRLGRCLERAGREALITREPGGTPTGETIRDILQHDSAGEPICSGAEALLFAASRAQLVHNVIKPALERGQVVVCDRFADSTVAYQGYGRGLDIDRIIALNEFALAGVRIDVTILLDLDVAAGFERIARRNHTEGGAHDRIEREEMNFHERVRAGYLDLAQRWPDRFRVIDANCSEDLIEEAAWQVVAPLLADAAPGCA